MSPFEPTPRACRSMLMSLLLGRLDCGPHDLDGSQWQSRLDARLASLLDCVTPAAQPLLTLLLRWHLDEQVPPSWATLTTPHAMRFVNRQSPALPCCKAPRSKSFVCYMSIEAVHEAAETHSDGDGACCVQVMVAAMQKGTSAADALSRARSTAQNAQAGAAKITEEEKVFTSRVRLSSFLLIVPLR